MLSPVLTIEHIQLRGYNARHGYHSKCIWTINLHKFTFVSVSVVDPGFRRRGAQLQRWDTNGLFRPISPKNCKEVKEIGPKGKGPTSPDPPMRVSISVSVFMFLIEEYVHCATKRKHC